MRTCALACLCLLLSPLCAQGGDGKAKPANSNPPPATRAPTVQYDNKGWPILPEDPTPAAGATPGGETGQSGRSGASGPKVAAPAAAPAPASGGRSAPGSGLQLDSPLLEVFQATQTPAAFKQLGSVSIWWRMTVYGEQGEVIGRREVTHTADSAFAERDRLEYADGRVYGRIGASVFAERSGMPFPNLVDSAEAELMLFGLHWRLPWCFGDANAYVVLARDEVVREEKALTRIVIERRPPAEFDRIGPELDEAPRDHFELVHEPGKGTPVEFLHRFARNRQPRRVLLEDWREHRGVAVPFRRVYVDEALRQTTSLEILRIEPVRTTERDFRLR
ncbi:MAG: hypothetical protein JNN13_19745 [Planctomycetes bacterium]|nr:hypothetical protein [Planctomycetota bacterium]